MGYNKQWENYTEKYQKLCMENDVIPDSLFKEYGVNRGLRDINGNGVFLPALPIFQELIPFA